MQHNKFCLLHRNRESIVYSRVANLFVREGRLFLFKHELGLTIVFVKHGWAALLNCILNAKIHHYLLVYLYL